MAKSEHMEKWMLAKAQMSDRKITFGKTLKSIFSERPQVLLNYLSYCKFAARMIGPGKRVLVTGCSEGIGAWVIACECGFACGIDTDVDAIQLASQNWGGEKANFEAGDISEHGNTGEWDAVVCFSHYGRESPASSTIQAAFRLLKVGGVVVVGYPSAAISASALENEWGVNARFRFEFFAINEVVQVGKAPGEHLRIIVAVK